MTDTSSRGERMLVYYPGHLGPEPIVEARGRLARPWQGPGVRDLPAKAGAGLVRYSGFVEAVTPEAAAARFGLPSIDPATVTTVKHGDPEVKLVLLDRATVRRLRALAATGAAGEGETQRSKPTQNPVKES